jgi:uncharacterized protein (DUF1800 family)
MTKHSNCVLRLQTQDKAKDAGIKMTISVNSKAQAPTSQERQNQGGAAFVRVLRTFAGAVLARLTSQPNEKLRGKRQLAWDNHAAVSLRCGVVNTAVGSWDLPARTTPEVGCYLLPRREPET